MFRRILGGSALQLTFDEGLAQLGSLLQKRRLLVMAGSGVSIPPPSSLPDWDSLLVQFIGFCKDQVVPLLDPADDFNDVVDAALRKRHRYPIHVASVLKGKLLDPELSRKYNTGGLFSRWVSEIFAAAKPNDNHRAIVSTNYPFILTTNYDDLLAKAAVEKGFAWLSARAFSYDDLSHVAAAIYEEEPCIIHVHGIYYEANLGRVVFTAQDYIGIKRRNSGFALALQGLLMRYSILFVGYGASDPHLEALMEEVGDRSLGSAAAGYPKFFIVLRKDKADKVLVKYKGQFSTDIIALDDYDCTTFLLEELRKVAPRN